MVELFCRLDKLKYMSPHMPSSHHGDIRRARKSGRPPFSRNKILLEKRIAIPVSETNSDIDKDSPRSLDVYHKHEQFHQDSLLSVRSAVCDFAGE